VHSTHRTHELDSSRNGIIYISLTAQVIALAEHGCQSTAVATPFPDDSEHNQRLRAVQTTLEACVAELDAIGEEVIGTHVMHAAELAAARLGVQPARLEE
jgi:hypothetical protein